MNIFNNAFRFFLAIFFSIGASFSFANYEEGAAAFNEKNYALAMRIFKESLKNGEPGAAFGLGLMYSKGLGVAKDPSMAIEYMKKGAEQNDVQAIFWLGYASYYGEKGIPLDQKKGIDLISKAANNGYQPARDKLVEITKSKSILESSNDELNCPPISIVDKPPHKTDNLGVADYRVVHAKTKKEIQGAIEEFCRLVSGEKLSGSYWTVGKEKARQCVATAQELKTIEDALVTKPPNILNIVRGVENIVTERCPVVMGERYIQYSKGIDDRELAETEKKKQQEKEKAEKELAAKKAEETKAVTISAANSFALKASSIPDSKRVLWSGNGPSKRGTKGTLDLQECLGSIDIDYYGNLSRPEPKVENLQMSFNKKMGAPIIADLRYVAEKGVYSFNIVGDRCAFSIPAVMSVPAKDVEAIKPALESMIPVVVFELSGDTLLAKYVNYYWFDGRSTQATLNYKVDFAFSERNAKLAAEYFDKKTKKERAEAEESERKADSQRDLPQKVAINFSRVQTSSNCISFGQQMQQIAFGGGRLEHRYEVISNMLSMASSGGCVMNWK